MKSFTTFRLLESSTESFGQVLITVFLLIQEPFDGVLNRSILGFGAYENASTTIMLFVVSTAVSFINVVFAFVNFISMRQGDVFGIASKIQLWTAYFLIVFLNLLLTTSIGITRQDYGDITPFLINIGTVSYTHLTLPTIYSV